MKDINHNHQTPVPENSNENTEVTDALKGDINKNEKPVEQPKDNGNTADMEEVIENNEFTVKEADSCENGEDETDKVVNGAEENVTKIEDTESLEKPSAQEEESSIPVAESTEPAFIPQYKYTDDNWSPLNTSGKKCYDIGLLKQIKEAPISKDKPNVPALETSYVTRTTPMPDEMEPLSLNLRPINDSLFPSFAKGDNFGANRNMTPRSANKKPMYQGRGSLKLNPTGGANSPHKPIIHVSLSLRKDIKFNESESAWKPSRFRKDGLSEDEEKDQEVYKKFRGILNKLTPQKFDTLIDRVKTLEINTQKRLEGVIDLIFEKAIEEPNFSEAYAAMCKRLSMLKVPADNPTTPDQCVNFRVLIINRCQKQFEANKTSEQVMKLEKELEECTDPAKKKELQLMLDEENRRVRMRSVGNVRFIGELYKLKMLTCKIMYYCMNYLIEKIEEEKLECLCKLLTTIGEQIEKEDASQLDNVFKKMKDLSDRKSKKLSSRVRFMMQDVIALRKRKWVVKSVVDLGPKMMDQIQKEAEDQQRHIELMNAGPRDSGPRRDDGGRGKRNDGRRGAQNAFMDSGWKTTKTTNFPVDTSKLKAVTKKSLNNIKLAPHQSAWNYGSSTKAPVKPTTTPQISISKNIFSVLENVQADPTSVRDMVSVNRDTTPSHSAKEVSKSDVEVTSDSDRSEAVASTSEAKSESRPVTPPPTTDTPAPDAVVPQEPITDDKMRKSVKSTVELYLINSDTEELVQDVKQLFQPQYHAALVGEILNVTLEKTAKDVAMVAKSLLHLVSTGTIAADNFLAGIKETFEFAPDLYIDIPKLYDYLGTIVAPHIEKKHITLEQIFNICGAIIEAKHGHLLLKAIINTLSESVGPTFDKSELGELSNWLKDDDIVL